MTKRHRSFAVKTRKDFAKDNDLTFDLGDETFNCVPELPGAVVLDFVAAADEGGGKSAGRILTFFDHAIVKDDQERFHTLIVDPERVVEMETLTDILAWLIEEYTARPTTASES
jgi:hypothetical protein